MSRGRRRRAKWERETGGKQRQMRDQGETADFGNLTGYGWREAEKRKFEKSWIERHLSKQDKEE